MQFKLAALIASSFAAMAVAGSAGFGSVDALIGALVDRGMPARALDSKFFRYPWSSELMFSLFVRRPAIRLNGFLPALDNATIFDPYMVANEYPAQAQMMFRK